MSAESPVDSTLNNNHVKLSEVQLIESEFGAKLEDCFTHAVKFYKDMEKKSEIQLSYDDRVKLMALFKQIKKGPFVASDHSVGWFDFVGNDVVRVWKELGDIGRDEAMASFVFLVDRVCPPFKGFIQDRIEAPAEEELHELSSTKASAEHPTVEVQQQKEVDWAQFEEQKKQIQKALNAQTYHQFTAYAKQQCAGQPEAQAALIRQLQEQHYEQYMSQVYAQQVAANKPKDRAPAADVKEQKARDDDSDLSDEEPGDDLPSNPAIAPASLWNRQDINEFKMNIKKEGSEGVIKVGHGETVTVRVPTHEDGTLLFWEFATDYYDIGFGVYFEWSIAESNQVSIHISESDDEEDYDEAAEVEAAAASNDVESAVPQTRKERDPSKPKQDEIIPVYRRDCHEEVYAGSHEYPGRGVYLLKFDNSYSLWRSKTLYYRIYYSK